MHKFFNIVLLAFLFVFGMNLNAKVFFVDDNATEGGDGTLWVNAYKYLQDALSVVSDGDEIWVAEGTYKPDQGTLHNLGDRASSFTLVPGVGLYGGFLGVESKRDPQGDSNKTILSGEIDENSTDWSLHVMYSVDLDSSSILDGFFISSGYADGQNAGNKGGGMYNQNSSPIVRNCYFSGNHANLQGGAIYNFNSSPSFIDCVFSDNSAGTIVINGYGGGMYNSSSSPIITNCTFLANKSTYQGAGMWGINCNSSITSCVFSGNQVSGNGGGAYFVNSAPSFLNSVIINNSGDFGGGIYVYSGSPSFYNCIVSNNTSSYKGGGLYSYMASPILMNCNFTGNSASSDGAAIFVSSIQSDLKPTIINCISWGNVSKGVQGHGIFGEWDGSGIPAQFVGDSKAVAGKPSILQGWSGDSRAIADNPMFENLNDLDGADDTWFTNDDGLRLKDGSPAIDVGSEVLNVPRYDLAGFVRTQNGNIDLGAYEYGGQLMILHTIHLHSNPDGSGVFIGAGIVEDGLLTSISASPQLGYIFSGWSGDANGSLNPLSILINSDKNITGYFFKDLNDTDGDGISNYDELVVYGTKVDDNDTDNDSLYDNEEVQIGSSPRISDKHIVDFLSVDTAESISLARSEGNSSGVAYVTANPAFYNLFREDDIAQAKQEGISDGLTQGKELVESNPSNYNLVRKDEYDQVLEELRIYKMVYVWEDYDQFSGGNLSSEKWELAWWKGAQPPVLVGGRLELGGTGRLHIPASKNQSNSDTYVSTLLKGNVLEAPRMKSFAGVNSDGVSAVEGRIFMPIGSPLETGIGLSAIQFSSEGTKNEFGVTLFYKDESVGKPELEFKYTDPHSGEQVKVVRPAEFNTHYRVSVIHTFEQNLVYLNDELIFKFTTTWSPNWYGFFGFMSQDDNWFSYRTYVDDVRVLKPSSANVMPTTPYTEGWFFVPDRGWLFTNRAIYPYFYDGLTSSWMYFLSGYDLPRFYHYGNKTWMDWTKLVEPVSTDSSVNENEVLNEDEPIFVQSSGINKSAKTHFAEAAGNIEMIWVEPGTFIMGSPDSEPNRGSNENLHDVNITKGFYLGKYEVTQSQYESVMQGNEEGVNQQPSQYIGTNRPVERISWIDANIFCDRLTKLEQAAGRLPKSWAYSLPTESEWEYACRGGTNSIYSWGESISTLNANYDRNLGQTVNVGQYSPNQFGFFDMHGNVWEWTDDWYDANYPVGSVNNPSGPESGNLRVMRGGAWNDNEENLRSAKRLGGVPTGKYNILGFRVSLKTK